MTSKSEQIDITDKARNSAEINSMNVSPREAVESILQHSSIPLLLWNLGPIERVHVVKRGLPAHSVSELAESPPNGPSF